MIRISRQLRPIHSTFVRYNSSQKPLNPPTTQHTVLKGDKSFPDPDQTTAHVPATTPTEDKTPIPADIVSGAPEGLHQRTVRIYRPAKSAMQSGLHGNLYWRLDWDVRPEDNRWEHPVMFWAARFHYREIYPANGSADYMQGTRMAFATKEDAIHFAEKQGWAYYVQEPHNRQFKSKAYATNFNYCTSTKNK